MGKRILIVDDDGDFRASLTDVLAAQGYTVLVAASGAEGLTMALAEKPDLVVLDIMMEHEWAGYELNQALKYGAGAADAIPILMVSSVPVDPATRFLHGGEAGMVTPDSYLTKPVDIPEFLAQVRRYVGA